MIYRFPDISTVIPFRPSNPELNAGPSTAPSVPSPAMVDTIYPDESGVNIRIFLFPGSHTYKFPDRSIVIPCGPLNVAVSPGPSEDPGDPT